MPARRWLIVAAACLVVLILVYVLAVLTVTGQELENAALRGADQAAARDQTAADQSLSRITLYSLGVAVVLVAVIGLLRRRPALAVAAVGVIVAGQVVTQGLKRFVLPRPSLVPLTGHYADNSMPSGHTTIAMTVLFAALLVVPYRWRGVTMVLLLSWAVGIGAYTVTAKWHRLSDTLAADAIALGLACLASWWLARRGVVHRYEGRLPDPAGARRGRRFPRRAGFPGPGRVPDRRGAQPGRPRRDPARQHLGGLPGRELARFGRVGGRRAGVPGDLAPPRDPVTTGAGGRDRPPRRQRAAGTGARAGIRVGRVRQISGV